mmetsp:Transcript_48428/g.128149  ORF Transcript_48428/g.128149 Transcript_48428/m.128149 type:complete len:281 (-) Transcript_48428:85-927(-)|eukprot:CAMPEP_0113664378 /NCGR_PEP_ID=MMETSP0038_2-20120614/1701_1 /TAXON_ID=2898 /ORGANISM="Cryptomonas paramecium" /LENGTH=280 /DNA_ID=CAMNT_0000579583 /DNA_START=154 /DNA_END=996 /DNA_ORIENTATION=- /assembly_acc=CAM_ASM_000170
MVKTQEQQILYQHPFDAVTASLWSKYDGHKYVKEVEVLDRYVDADGKLHSKRLLSMSGNIPTIFRPLIPFRYAHLLETVVVDPVARVMTVSTKNLNMADLLVATSHSRYNPLPPIAGTSEERTQYIIDIRVEAFPETKEKKSDGFWKVNVKGPSNSGYIAGKLESWAASKLLGNVNKSERFVQSFCERWRSRHILHCSEAVEQKEYSDARFDSQIWMGGENSPKRPDAMQTECADFPRSGAGYICNSVTSLRDAVQQETLRTRAMFRLVGGSWSSWTQGR